MDAYLSLGKSDIGKNGFVAYDSHVNDVTTNSIKSIKSFNSSKTIKQTFEKSLKKTKILNKTLEKPEPLQSKQKLLLESLLKFYDIEKNKKLIVPIVKQETSISLRLLDWLVTNYSKKYGIHYDIGSNRSDCIPSNKNFNLWLDYKNQLKAYSKKQFDPFCRRQRIFFNTETNQADLISVNDVKLYDNREDGIVTTVGQLNFFKWAIINRVIDYAFENLEKIESDMLSSADKRAKSKDGKKVKRQLSKNNHSAKAQEIKVVIQFSQ